MSVKEKSRRYQLNKRADKQAETRERIIEAAVALHEALGPASTSISGIAERAGVGRPTVYRNFPDEQSLFEACTSHYFERHPFPDQTHWRLIGDAEARVQQGLLDMYRWYRENEPMLISGLRDLPKLPVLQVVLEPMFGQFDSAAQTLIEVFPVSSPILEASIGHALEFTTWRSLALEHGLADEVAAELMTAMVLSASRQEVAIPV